MARVKPGVHGHVLKIDEEWHVLETYRSLSEAGKANYMDKMAVWLRIRGKVKKEFRNGYSFRYEDQMYEHFNKKFVKELTERVAVQT